MKGKVKSDSFEKAFSYARRLLNIRPRSIQEIRYRLYAKGFNKKAAEKVIEVLKAKHILDDKSFARMWVESKMRSSPRGDLLFKKELLQKGVSREIIESVLSEKKGSEGEIIKELVYKKLHTLIDLPPEKVRKKLFDFLVRRGFSFDMIENVLNEVLPG